MKVLAITLILFTAMLFVISQNYIYINEVSEQIITLVNDGSIYELEEYWNENLLYVGFSVGYRELDRMSELIVELKSYYEAGYTAEFMRVRHLVAEAAGDISRLEKFSLENLI